MSLQISMDDRQNVPAMDWRENSQTCNFQNWYPIKREINYNVSYMDKHVHGRMKLFPKRKLTSTPRLALAIANSCNFVNNMNIEKIKDYRRCCCSIAAAWIADGWYYLAHPDWKLRKSNKPWQRDLRFPAGGLEECLGEGRSSMPLNPTLVLIHPRRPRSR